MSIFLSNIPEYVQKELFKRMDIDERNPGNYAKAVWTRAKCWAVKTNEGAGVEAPTLMGGTLNPDNSMKGGFDQIYQPRSDGSSDGSSLKPMAGITNVSISTFGSLGSTRKAQLQFKIYGMNTLDVFLSTYMSLGSTVSIEYGWSHHQNYGSTYEAISGDIIGSFKDMQSRIEQGGGNYDGFVGLVSNYNFKAMPDGGFDCGIDLIGHGQAILATQVSDELPKVTLENPAEDEDAEIAFGKIGAVNFKTAINNLEKDVANYEFDGEEDGIWKEYVYVEEGGTSEKKLQYYISWGFMEDNLLSKYFGYVSEGKDGENIIFDVRSLNKNKDGTFESVKILNHPALRKFGSDPRIAFFGTKFEIDKNTGNLRELFISVNTLKESFENAESLTSGLDTLFAKVNGNFADIWDFKVVADENVLTRSKIIDSNWSQNKPEELLANDKRSSSDNPTGLFYFPAYDKKSIVRTINLEGKMPSAAAMTVLYGKNQPEDSSDDKAAAGDSADSNTGKSEGAASEDLVMNKMRNPKGFGNSNYYDANTELSEGAFPDTAETIYTNDGEIVSSQEIALRRLVDTESQNETVGDSEEDDSAETEKTEEEIKKEQQQATFYTNHPEKKPLTQAETRQMRIDVRKKEDGVENNVPFLIPIDLSLTLDGIGGIIWGNAFHCEYLPDLYKQKGIFQVTAVDHSITAGGWETTIKGQMRSISITALKEL